MRPAFKVILIGFVIIVGFFLFNEIRYSISSTQIKVWISEFGAFAPIVFIAVFIFRPLTLFPSSILSITSGLIFGAYAGAIYAFIGSMGGAFIAFSLARKYGKPLNSQQFFGKSEGFKGKIEEKGFNYILMLRLAPVVNFDLISYLSGVSNVSLRSFISATMIGIIPGTIAYNFFGSSFISKSKEHALVALILVLGILFFTLLLKRIQRI